MTAGDEDAEALLRLAVDAASQAGRSAGLLAR
jgi:hypothetical protein